MRVADRHSLSVIEDSAHAHGSEWRRAQSRCAHHGRCLQLPARQEPDSRRGRGGCDEQRRCSPTACGFPQRRAREGSAGRCCRDAHGQLPDGRVVAGILRSQLKRLPEQNRRRRETALASSRLRDIGGLEPLPEDPRITDRGYYFYVSSLRCRRVRRSCTAMSFLRAMQAEGCSCAAGYGVPVHKHRRSARRPTARRMPQRGAHLRGMSSDLWNHLCSTAVPGKLHCGGSRSSAQTWTN